MAKHLDSVAQSREEPLGPIAVRASARDSFNPAIVVVVVLRIASRLHAENLIRKSIVAIVPGSSPPRYRLLETTRSFVLEELAKSGRGRMTREKHAAYVLQILEEATVKWEATSDDDKLHVVYAVPLFNVFTGCRLGNVLGRIVDDGRQIIANGLQNIRTMTLGRW